ncbi:3-deoxy-D-manno-octulosonic acid transferase [Pseudotabrizicola alkalilacus]|uniref:3-deoxy-D-manno-octulosonic acid transferase n=1 Tax=Pseudotabrizicola alkalilacus TaxID=2305252 RepID=A0A411Z2B8_9RHOB|nr:glycosyltransferase N-terminal domain-containing protein [Pseudotabrizicola alkalilacus]RGP37214.1 3-deoxy-D-manno-octulosonic acid transferase [Pseudotabrizicola alkalilacus]
MIRAFLLLWSALWTFGLPLILLYLWRRGRKDPAYTAHLAERFGRYGAPVNFRRKFAPGPVWVHAVSLGELRSAVPLIRALLDRGDTVVTTHFTPAGRGEAERVFAADIAADRLRAVWVPLETGWAYRGFFRAFQPSYGLVMEIEIWPRMVAAARAHGVPLFMCNAQYPSRAITRDSKGLRLRQAVMRGFAGALVKSDLQRQRFAAVGVQNIAVTGELRFDQPVPPALVAAGQAARVWIGAQDRRVITIASAIEDEDATYIHAIHALRADHTANALPMPLIVYVPRRPERFNEVAQALADEGFSTLRRSSLPGTFDPSLWGASPAIPDIFFGDSLGEMYGYLAMADQVIVGGGFNPKGAHNISEALVLGKPVITGPHTHTIEYPFAEAEAAGVARSVPDAERLAADLLANRQPDAARIAAFVAAHSDATRKTLAAIPQLLAVVRPS